jgi:hypothetical protein
VECEKENIMMKKFTLPAGKYYIGDPRRVISNRDVWIEFLDSCGYFVASPEARNGEDKFWAYGTTIGSKTYHCSKGKEIHSDSGLIGIVPLSVVEKYYQGNIDNISDLGLIVEFGDTFDTIFDTKNEVTHVFGDIRVYANDDGQ